MRPWSCCAVYLWLWLRFSWVFCFACFLNFFLLNTVIFLFAYGTSLFWLGLGLCSLSVFIQLHKKHKLMGGRKIVHLARYETRRVRRCSKDGCCVEVPKAERTLPTLTKDPLSIVFRWSGKDNYFFFEKDTRDLTLCCSSRSTRGLFGVEPG